MMLALVVLSDGILGKCSGNVIMCQRHMNVFNHHCWDWLLHSTDQAACTSPLP